MNQHKSTLLIHFKGEYIAIISLAQIRQTCSSLAKESLAIELYYKFYRRNCLHDELAQYNTCLIKRSIHKPKQNAEELWHEKKSINCEDLTYYCKSTFSTTSCF